MSCKVFINYRRSDSEGMTGRLYDRLLASYASEDLFIDVDSISKGDDFVHVMQQKIEESDVVLVVIGGTWLNVTDADGARRIDDPDDPVRIEIQRALELEKIVIPVLLNRADMPQLKKLPEPLRPLVRRNAERLTHESFAGDVRRLTDSIERAVKVAAARKAAHERNIAEQAARIEEATLRPAPSLFENESGPGSQPTRGRALEGDSNRHKSSGDRRSEAGAKSKRKTPDQNDTAKVKPSARDLASALDRQEELLRWEFVRSRRRIPELREHLARWPQGSTADMAQALLEPLEWESIQFSTDANVLAEFVARFPNGDYRALAEERLTGIMEDVAGAREGAADLATPVDASVGGFRTSEEVITSAEQPGEHHQSLGSFRPAGEQTNYRQTPHHHATQSNRDVGAYSIAQAGRPSALEKHDQLLAPESGSVDRPFETEPESKRAVPSGRKLDRTATWQSRGIWKELVARPPALLFLVGGVSGGLSYLSLIAEGHLPETTSTFLSGYYIDGASPGIIFGVMLAGCLRLSLGQAATWWRLLLTVLSTLAGWLVAWNLGRHYFEAMDLDVGLICGLLGSLIMVPGVAAALPEMRRPPSQILTIMLGGLGGLLLPLDMLILFPAWQAMVGGSIGLSLQQQLWPETRDRNRRLARPLIAFAVIAFLFVVLRFAFDEVLFPPETTSGSEAPAN